MSSILMYLFAIHKLFGELFNILPIFLSFDSYILDISPWTVTSQDILCKHVLPDCDFSFHSLNSIFERNCALSVLYLRNLYLISQICFPLFNSRSFILFCLMF